MDFRTYGAFYLSVILATAGGALAITIMIQRSARLCFCHSIRETLTLDSVTCTNSAFISYGGSFVLLTSCHCHSPLFALGMKGEGPKLGSPLRETESPGLFYSQPHPSFLTLVSDTPILDSASGEATGWGLGSEMMGYCCRWGT